MPINADLAKKLENLLVNSVNALLEEQAAHIRESLSDPYPPASAKGEAPHMRTGALREGVKVVPATAEGHMVGGEIVSERNGSDLVPAVLEYQLNRPYMSSAHLEMAGGGAAKGIARNLQQRLNG